jgi:eukaryotic-like serine/threonine-protein kinase
MATSTSAWRAPPRGTTDARSAEESRAYLQERLALFGKSMGVIATAFAAVIFVSNWALFSLDGALEDLLGAARGRHMGLMAMFLALHLAARRGRLSLSVLNALDIGTTVASSLLIAGVGVWPQLSMINLAVLALTDVLMARAILVPSTARRTFWLGVAAAVLAVAQTWLVFAGTAQREIEPALAAVIVAQWSALTVAITTVASRILYGLREEVRDARQLGQYTLEERIAEGGMGVVYRARHAMLRRETAIKLLLPDRIGERSLDRFEREVRLTARLTHPNTVAIFDYGRTPDGVFYCAMEYLNGFDLGEVVRETGPLSPGRVVRVLSQVAGALGEAHEIGLIHRDIKPANILLTRHGGEDDIAKVVDFGLVKDLREETDPHLTEMGGIAGTPLYMAPEAMMAPEQVDARADLYALGAVGYYLLTGSHVFKGRTLSEIGAQHILNTPEPLSRRAGRPIPAELERLVLGCLAKRPEERPRSARALREELLDCRDVAPWTEADARAWWAAHGPRLASRRRSALDVDEAGAAVRAVAVDLASRG